MSETTHAGSTRQVDEHALHLSILSSPAGTAWAVHRMATGRCIALHQMDIGDHWDHPDMPEDPRSISFITLPEWSTMVPESALAPGSEADHLALVHGGIPTGAMRDEPIESLSARCIFVHDDVAERALLDRFPAARPLSLQALMVRVAQARSEKEPLLLVHRSKGRCDIAVASGARILLSNGYPAITASDLLYFTLLAAERTGHAPHTVALHYGGEHLTDAETALLQKYFARARPAIGHDHFAGGKAVKHPERWMALVEQYTCAS